MYNIGYINNNGSLRMTMHLAHPSLSMGGKRKGKKKFRNADEARKARELDAEWERNQAKWASMSTKVTLPKREVLSYKLSAPAGRESTHKARSLPDTHLGAVSSKATQQYTGTKMLGIGTLHKSNAVPVFSDDEAKEMARMRRG
jgi:hypothetical protein